MHDKYRLNIFIIFFRKLVLNWYECHEKLNEF